MDLKDKFFIESFALGSPRSADNFVLLNFFWEGKTYFLQGVELFAFFFVPKIMSRHSYYISHQSHLWVVLSHLLTYCGLQWMIKAWRIRFYSQAFCVGVRLWWIIYYNVRVLWPLWVDDQIRMSSSMIYDDSSVKTPTANTHHDWCVVMDACTMRCIEWV